MVIVDIDIVIVIVVVVLVPSTSSSSVTCYKNFEECFMNLTFVRNDRWQV